MVTFNSKDTLTPDEFEKYTKILIATLWKGGYPHEVMVCIFNKCFVEVAEDVDEKREPQKSKERKMWPPQRIAKELSDTSLGELSNKLKEDYIAASSLPEELVRDCFRLLDVKMQRIVSEIINPSDRSARKRWAKIMDKLVGETTLLEYYGGSSEDNIADWSHQVLRRMERFLVENNWLERPLEEFLKEDP